AMPSAVVYGNIFEVVGKGKELAFAGLDRITASLASYQFHDRPLELGNLGGILQIKALPLLRLRELDGIEVDRGRPDGHRPVHQPAQIAVVVAMYRWLDAYGEILSASVAALHQHSDTPAHPFEGAIDAPCPVVDLAGRPVDRHIEREGTRSDHVGHSPFRESGAVGNDAPPDVVLAAEGDQLQEMTVYERLAAHEIDDIRPYIGLQAEQGLHPILQAHFLPFLPSPVQTVLTPVVATIGQHRLDVLRPGGVDFNDAVEVLPDAGFNPPQSQRRKRTEALHHTWGIPQMTAALWRQSSTPRPPAVNAKPRGARGFGGMTFPACSRPLVPGGHPSVTHHAVGRRNVGLQT